MLDPVFAGTADALIYTVLLPGRTDSVYGAERDPSGEWLVRGSLDLDNPALRLEGDKRRIPSGLSSDQRTLFFFDEPTGQPMAIERGTGGTFSGPVALPGLRGAQPNATCGRLYVMPDDAAAGIALVPVDRAAP